MLLAINFLVPEDPSEMEQNRFKLDFNMVGQELPPFDLIPSRIKASLPKAKIIMVIRNQITWLRSHYLYHIQNLPKGHHRFCDYLNCLDGKRIVRAGLLHLTIAAYQETFGREKVKVLLLEQISRDLNETIAALCSFIGVEYMGFPLEKRKTHTGKPLLAGRAVQALSNVGISIKSASKLSKLYGPLLHYVSRMAKPQVLSRNEVSLLKSFYSHSNLETSKLIDLDLSLFGYPI